LIWGLLLACNGGLQPLNDTDAQADGAVVIESIDPEWGSPDGGTAVTITGKGFEGALTVKFGNAEVGATRIDPTTILVETPFAGIEATVDVTVVSELGQDVLEDGFTYSDEAVGNDTDDVDPTGKSGGVVELSLLQVACPDCFGLTSDLEVYANAAFHEPVNGSWTEWLPPSGSCVADPVQGGPASTLLDVGEWVYLTSGSRSIGLRRTSGSSGILYSATGLGNEDYARTAQYTVSVPDGGELGGSFEVDNAVSTPQGFTSITPAELLYVDSSAAFAAPVRRSGSTTFTWAPSGGTGTFVILISAYHPSSGSYLGSVLCRDADNGSMSVPGSVLSAYPAGALLAVYLWRYQIEEWIIPANGATVESVATVGVLGTGVLR
jgi:hypothetical protein